MCPKDTCMFFYGMVHPTHDPEGATNQDDMKQSLGDPKSQPGSSFRGAFHG